MPNLKKNIQIFKDKHKNQKAFIICNGPSLNDIDLKKLNDSVVFILNRGYRLASRGLDISKTYLVVIDNLIHDQFGPELNAVKCAAKFSNKLNGSYKLKWSAGRKIFGKDLTKSIWQGHSVTNVALQIAYYMGCNPVYIVGMDHTLSYDEYDRKENTFYVKDKDINHFDEDYLPEGYRFNYQDLGAVEIGYRLATEEYWGSGRELYNASTYTELGEDIMPRIKFDEIWS